MNKAFVDACKTGDIATALNLFPSVSQGWCTDALMITITWLQTSKNNDIIDLLIDKANLNHKNSFNKTPLILAASKGDINTVKKLINKGADIQSEDNYPVLYNAVKSDSFGIVKLAIKNGANANIKDSSENLLLIACKNMNEDIALYLYRNGAFDEKNAALKVLKKANILSFKLQLLKERLILNL